MQKLDGIALLNEILSKLPLPLMQLLYQLASSLDPESTQTRFVEIGPIHWWKDNLMRMPMLSELLLGGKRVSFYFLSTVTIRLTNIPIFSRASNRCGLIFVELKMHLSLPTPRLLKDRDAYIQCKHFSRNEWTGIPGKDTEGGSLVRLTTNQADITTMYL